MYYLQSRYYNPEWGRFINADSYGGELGTLLSHNIFAYCRNNPVSRIDSDGYRDEAGCGGGGGAYLELGIIEEEEGLLLRNIISSEMDEQLALEAQEMRIADEGAAKADDFAKETFLPDKAYNKNLPKQVEPGTKSLPKYDEFGNLKQIKHYDEYGREKGWGDYTNHGFENNHTSPHWHEVQYDSQYPLGRIIDHRMDPIPPF